MSPAREAFGLPLLFLTVLLLGGVHVERAVTVAPPSLFSLVLAMLVCATLVRSGTVAPARLLAGTRSSLANLNGLVVLLTTFAASAQALSLVMPESGLPAAIAGLLLLAMLVQMLATSPDRTALLRGLMVTFGAGFTLKFVLLASVSSPADGRVARALQVLLDNVTLGALAQPPIAPVEGYLAFATLALYLVGLALLPRSRWALPADAMIVAPAIEVDRTGN